MTGPLSDDVIAEMEKQVTRFKHLPLRTIILKLGDVDALLTERRAAQEEIERLRAALRNIARRGPVFDAKGTWSKEVCEIANAALQGAPHDK